MAGMMVYQSHGGTACALAVANSRVEDKNATKFPSCLLLRFSSE